MKSKILILLTLVIFLGGMGVAVAATAANTTKTTKINTACIQSAVEKRESAIITAYTKKTDAIKTALEARKAALVTAWGKSTVKERVQARAKAWKTFKATQVKAQITYQRELVAAWATFNKERKTCRISESNDENGSTDLGL